MKVIVKDGKELAHGGDVLRGGAVIDDLPTHIVQEVRHLVDELDDAGRRRSIGSVDDAARLAAELETARPHERISILEAARGRALGNLKDIDEAIAAERRAIEVKAAPAERQDVQTVRDSDSGTKGKK